MRTTLNIADDVLLAAKELAQKSKKTTGQVISELARKGLASVPEDAAEFMGFRPLPKRAMTVTCDLINQMRDEEGI